MQIGKVIQLPDLKGFLYFLDCELVQSGINMGLQPRLVDLITTHPSALIQTRLRQISGV